MGTKVGQNWNQSIHYDILFCRQVSFTLPQGTPSREFPFKSLKMFKTSPLKQIYKQISIS
jgi:hypothetical protein